MVQSLGIIPISIIQLSQFGQYAMVSGTYADDLHQPVNCLLGITEKLIYVVNESRAMITERLLQVHNLYRHTEKKITPLISRIQVGQLVHDLGVVPQNGMELQEAVQRLIQAVQFLIG